MAFNWNTISGNIASADYNEIKNNIDEVCSKLEISNFNWTSASNISIGSIVTRNSVQELRDGTDYLDDNNYCHSHYTSDYYYYRSGHFYTVESNFYSGVQSYVYESDYSDFKSTIKDTYYNTNQNIRWNSYNSGVYNDNDSSIMNFDYLQRHGTKYTIVYSTYCPEH